MTQHNEKQVCNIFISSRGSQAIKSVDTKNESKSQALWCTFVRWLDNIPMVREHDMRPKSKFLLEKFHFWKRSRKKYNDDARRPIIASLSSTWLFSHTKVYVQQRPFFMPAIF